MFGDVHQAFHREQAFRRAHELGADVDVQTDDLQPCSCASLDRGDRVVRDEPELRIGMCRPDRVVRLRLDLGRQAHEDACDTCHLRPRDLLERVEHDEPARSCGSPELLVGLVVAVENEPVAGNACAQRELQLTERRDVGSHPSAASSRSSATFANAFVPYTTSASRSTRAYARARARTVSRQ